jgi:hypothetical protein
MLQILSSFQTESLHIKCGAVVLLIARCRYSSLSAPPKIEYQTYLNSIYRLLRCVQLLLLTEIQGSLRTLLIL